MAAAFTPTLQFLLPHHQRMHLAPPPAAWRQSVSFAPDWDWTEGITALQKVLAGVLEGEGFWLKVEVTPVERLHCSWR